MTDPIRLLGDDHAHDGEGMHSHGDGEAHHHHGISSKQVQNIKTIFLILYLLITYLGILPYAISACRNSSRVLSYMNCFAAGVFISIALIHLLPEGAEQYDGWAAENEIDDPFPLLYTMAVIGVLIAIIVDRVIFAGKPSSPDGVELQPVTSDEKATDRTGEAVAAPQGAAQALTGSVTNTKPAAVLAMTGLAFQVFVEAIGFGTLAEVDSVSQLFSGLLINACTISVALGSALIKAGFNKRQLIIILTCFTLIAPIGMIIGMAAGSEMPAPVNVVLLALTTGFYLYFSCAEVISKEFKDGQNAMGKIIAMVIGLLIILGLVFIESAHAH